MERPMKHNNDNGWAWLLVAALLLFNPITTSAIFHTAQADPDITEETLVEEPLEESLEEEKSDTEVTEIKKEPFEVVYSYGSEFRIVRFLPTDVLYVSHNRGDLTMMEDADGKPVTYKTYTEFMAKADYTITVESAAE